MFNLDRYEYFEDVNLGLLKYIPSNKTILDVGCGSGLLGKLYRKNKNVVIGIDNSLAIESRAKQRLNRFYDADITSYKQISTLLRNLKFDVIIFADILEHVYDPIGLINFYKKFLKKEGLIYISVPNIAVWYVRIGLFFGKFSYSDTGTLDRAHIRFFTKKNLLMLQKYCNLQIVNLDITPSIARFFLPYIKKIMVKKTQKKSLLQSPEYKIYAKYFYNIEYYLCKVLPGLFAFQYVSVFKKQ